jgi:hypothetical protein
MLKKWPDRLSEIPRVGSSILCLATISSIVIRQLAAQVCSNLPWHIFRAVSGWAAWAFGWVWVASAGSGVKKLAG